MENIEILDKEQELSDICSICRHDFDDGEYLPKILRCGHTFCHSCVNNLDSVPRFYECCSLMYRDRSSMNETHMKFLRELKMKRFINNQIEIKGLKNSLESKRIALAKLIENGLEIFDSNLEKIDELLNNEETMKMNLKLDIEKIKKEINSINTNIFATKISIEPPMPFLKEINKKLKSGVKLSTIHQRITKTFCIETLFGKISSWRNNIYFHCLEKREPEENEEFIRFEDLKTVAVSERFNLFLRTNIKSESFTNAITIEPFESLLLPNFVRFFTGEIETSYKNKSFQAEHEINIETGSLDFKGCSVKMAESVRAEYQSIFKSENIPQNLSDESKDTIYFYGNCYGSFMLCSLNNLISGEKKKLIGKIASPSNVFSLIEKSKKIIDSGIMLTFKFDEE